MQGATEIMAAPHTTGSGTYFVLPPNHRLFAIFDRPADGREAIHELSKKGMADESDVWIFYGEKGVQSVDPGVTHHGVPVAVVRIFQRIWTNDCEYCDGLSHALQGGAMVLAVKAAKDAVPALSQVLQEHGGHSLAYGEHLNFVPLAGSGHAIGSSTDSE
jgi:hypothetical protein